MNQKTNLHDQLELYAAGALAGAELDGFVVHLDNCHRCRADLPVVMEAAASLIPDSPPPIHLWAAISAAI